MKTVYVGLDSATIAGVAFYCPDDHRVLVSEMKSNPIFQLNQLNTLILENRKILKYTNMVFVFEQLVHFRNANTTRSLLERSGFLKWNLKGLGFTVADDIDPNVARKFLGVKDKDAAFEFLGKFYDDKGLTNNHTDAVALVLFQADKQGYAPNYEKLKIERIEL